jgi:diguanylate cyclase (GGDEF)-like protein/PAS domain S-box-containing protein
MNWSDEVFRIFGFAPQSFKPDYEALLKTVAPEDQERIQTTIDNVMSNNEPLDFENHIVQPGGNVRIVHQQAKLDFNQDGKLLKILGTIQDVTESKAAEQGLQLAARVFENASEGIIITDADNNIVDVNRAFTVITGYSKNDVIGKNPRIFKSGKHETEFYQDMWKTLLENGVWQGELWGRRKSGEIYPKWESISTIRLANGKINNYLAIFRDITEAKKYEERLWKLAHYDNLCGVANRSLMYANLHQAISHAKRDKHLVAFMLFDLDHFKSINDTQGHDAGDQLLVHVSNQLKNSIRDTDTVARLGGDEFTVILGNMHNKEDVLHVVDKIRKALGSSLTLQNGDSVVVSASIGIALYPDDAADVETLMKCADRAMYHAKELGRNNAQLFREGMSHETRPESPSFDKII